MTFVWQKHLKVTVHQVLQAAGYHFFRNPQNSQASYCRRAGSGNFPRFHIYLKEEQKGIFLNLHLDQKKSHQHTTRLHAGEYESGLVEEESERIKRWLQYYSL